MQGFSRPTYIIPLPGEFEHTISFAQIPRVSCTGNERKPQTCIQQMKLGFHCSRCAHSFMGKLRDIIYACVSVCVCVRCMSIFIVYAVIANDSRFVADDMWIEGRQIQHRVEDLRITRLYQNRPSSNGSLAIRSLISYSNWALACLSMSLCRGRQETRKTSLAASVKYWLTLNARWRANKRL